MQYFQDSLGLCGVRHHWYVLDNFLVFFHVSCLCCSTPINIARRQHQYCVLCEEEFSMDVDFMLSDSLEVSQRFKFHDRNLIAVQAVRPKLAMPKSIEEAAAAVDEMFNTVMQNAGCRLKIVPPHQIPSSYSPHRNILVPRKKQVQSLQKNSPKSSQIRLPSRERSTE